MARRRRIPPTRFPHSMAASYARAVSALIQRMHSIAYEAFRAVVAARAVQYRKESSRLDASPIDDILAALQWARRRSENGVFNTASLNGIAQRFVQGVNFFNRNNVNDQLRVKGIDPTANEPWLDAFMRASVQENVTLIKSIEQDYFKRVESIILQGVKNGQSIPDIASAIKGTADVSYNKAKFIARDQTGSITGQLTSKRHQAAGAARFQWSSSGDSRVRPEHAHFDGNVYYYSEGAGPRGLLPGQDFNCRCVAYPIFDDEDITEEKPVKPGDVGISQESFSGGPGSETTVKVHPNTSKTEPQLKADLWRLTKLTKNEHGAMINMDSGEQMDIILEGTQSVIQNHELLKRMEEGKRYKYIHTHPGGTSFSLNDVLMMSDFKQIRELIALAGDIEYTISLEENAGQPTPGLLQIAYSYEMERLLKPHLKRYRAIDRIPKSDIRRLSGDVWKTVAPAFHMDYTEIKR